MRACCLCHRPIAECMGHVLARDLLAFFDGKRTKAEVRELCGLCVLRPYEDVIADIERLSA